jgi:hypothetical protein
VKIVRFASAPNGGSQFVEVDFPIDNASTDAWGHTARRSAVLPAQSAMVTEMPEGLYQDWHPASRRQLLFVLSGTLEIETRDGTKRQCSSGTYSSPTMSAAAATAAARSVAQPACCSCICRPMPRSAGNGGVSNLLSFNRGRSTGLPLPTTHTVRRV